MKRDPDLEREILLYVEEHGDAAGGFVDLSGIGDVPDGVKGYHVLLLSEAGLLKSMDARTMGSPYDYLPERLTMAGHQYLDSIRDPKIWAKTKAGAEQVGDFSLQVLGQLAKGFIEKRVEERTGIKINLD